MNISTNKTTNYGLHAWEAGDSFLREEFNENFAALDEKAVQMVFGSYTGDGKEIQTVSLGFTPRAVLAAPKDGYIESHSLAMTIPGSNAARSSGGIILEIVEGGFQVTFQHISTGTTLTLNASGRVHHFWAIP